VNEEVDRSHEEFDERPSPPGSARADNAALNEEAARKLIDVRVGEKAQARIDELASKCNEDDLTGDERAEYETYVLTGEFLAILQAQSRRLLSRRERAS
jgi:hypothetical protein